jgi:Domain of unknown function (DUF5658)
MLTESGPNTGEQFEESMPDSELETAAPMRTHLSDECVQMPQRRAGRIWNRTTRLLLMLLVELQLADVLTTNHALAKSGVWEANPLMAMSQAKLGAAWWLPKIAAIGLIAIMARSARRRWPLIAMVVVSLMPVLINLAQL